MAQRSTHLCLWPFGLSAEELCLAAVYAVKLMMTSWSDCKKFRNDSERKAAFLKRVSQWHQDCLKPLMNEVACRHTPPLFVRKCITEEKTATDPSLSSLHLRILIDATKILRRYCITGCCLETKDKVQKWYQLMETASQSRLVWKSRPLIKKELAKELAMAKGHSTLPLTCKSLPFFHHDSFFIRVAHMVYFFANGSSTGEVPTGPEDIQEWEAVSGMLALEVFDLSRHGLQLTDGVSITDTEFAGIILPYNQMRDQIFSRAGVSNLPDMTAAQENVMQAFLRTTLQKAFSLSDLPVSEDFKMQNALLQHWFSTTSERNKIAMKRWKQNEKQRKHYASKALSNSKACSSRDPSHFDRDVFVMGKESHQLHQGSLGKYQLTLPCKRKAKRLLDEGSESTVRQGNTSSFVGQRVAKDFDSDLHFGTVKRYDNDESPAYWHVEYDDGDSEDYSKKDLTKALSYYTVTGKGDKRK